MGVVYIRKKKLNEAGFTNPFDEIGNKPDYMSSPSDDDLNDPAYRHLKKNAINITGVSLWNTNAKNKIKYEHGKMYAAKYFIPGDIVEESPIKIIGEKDLYSETIREIAFPIDPERGLYALPLGYANCYRNSKEAPVPGNITYEYDENRNMLVFKAISNIKSGQELVLDVDDSDFANELHPGQFQYNQGAEPIYNVKNYKLV